MPARVDPKVGEVDGALGDLTFNHAAVMRRVPFAPMRKCVTEMSIMSSRPLSDQGTMHPGTGVGDIEMIATGLRLELPSPERPSEPSGVIQLRNVLCQRLKWPLVDVVTYQLSVYTHLQVTHAI